MESTNIKLFELIFEVKYKKHNKRKKEKNNNKRTYEGQEIH